MPWCLPSPPPVSAAQSPHSRSRGGLRGRGRSRPGPTVTKRPGCTGPQRSLEGWDQCSWLRGAGRASGRGATWRPTQDSDARKEPTWGAAVWFLLWKAGQGAWAGTASVSGAQQPLPLNPLPAPLASESTSLNVVLGKGGAGGEGSARRLPEAPRLTPQRVWGATALQRGWREWGWGVAS